MQFVAILALIALAVAHPTFEDWAKTHGKVYSATEHSLRAKIYSNNIAYADAENAKGHSYTLGATIFADLTNAEYRQLYLAPKVDYSDRLLGNYQSNVDLNALPTSVNWVTAGAVTPIKNQGQCGSCWSFSTTGSVEGQHFLSTNNLVSLSEENLVECSDAEGNEGCNGGLMTQAFQYIINNNGIDTEASYPYTSGNGVVGNCAFSASNVGATISSYANIPSGSEADLQNATALVGPISVAMDASLESFQLYTSGIYAPKGCSSTALDHGVLSIGYGVLSSQDYWYVKNSWGTSWGIQGYFYLARNDNNMCGIATMASYPIV